MNFNTFLKRSFTFPSILLLALLSTYFIFFGFLPGWGNVNSDFPNYYTSSKLLLDNENSSNIYNDEWFQKKINEYGIREMGKFSPFPPVTSFVMLIPAVFKPITAKRIYLAFNFLLLLLTAYFFYRVTEISVINSLNIILLSGVGIINNFLLGQFYLILLFLIVTGYYYYKIKKSFIGGILWGAGAAVKYFPFVFIPVLLNKERRKLLFGILTSVFILNIIGVLIFGLGVYKSFIISAFLPHLNGELSNQSQFAHQFQSWNSFLRTVFIFNPVENPNPLINWQLGFSIFRAFIYLTVIFFITVSLLKLKNNSNEFLLKLSLLSVALLLLSPASASYHFLILAFPTILLLNHTIKNNKECYGYIFLTVYILIGFLPVVLHRITANYDSNLFFSYHRLWLITVYFIFLVYYLMKGNKGAEKIKVKKI